MDSYLEKEPNHSPAAAVVALTKHNCTLVKRPEKSGGGGAEVWKHFGYYPPKLKLEDKWVKEHPVCIHCHKNMHESDVDPKNWEVNIGESKSTSKLTKHMVSYQRGSR